MRLSGRRLLGHRGSARQAHRFLLGRGQTPAGSRRERRKSRVATATSLRLIPIVVTGTVSVGTHAGGPTIGGEHDGNEPVAMNWMVEGVGLYARPHFVDSHGRARPRSELQGGSPIGVVKGQPASLPSRIAFPTRVLSRNPGARTASIRARLRPERYGETRTQGYPDPSSLARPALCRR